MRARGCDAFRDDCQEFKTLIAQILPDMPTGSDPIDRTGGPSVFGHSPIRSGIFQMRVGKPDHQPRAENVVHRGLLTRRDMYADNDYRFVFKFDIAHIRQLVPRSMRGLAPRS